MGPFSSVRVCVCAREREREREREEREREKERDKRNDRGTSPVHSMRREGEREMAREEGPSVRSAAWRMTCLKHAFWESL